MLCTFKFPNIINISTAKWLLKEHWSMELTNVVIYKLNLNEEIRNDREPICTSMQAEYKSIKRNMQ
jgi:hypothetical protein